MFITLRKKVLLVVLFLISAICALCIYFCRSTSVDSPNIGYTIVIDAGHGGEDGGAVGTTGVTESYLNLQYAKELEKICNDAGFNVVMTRKDMNGLYSALAPNKKRSEMEKRESIINGSNADIIISIHMNSFPLSSCKGAQAFYKKDNSSGKALAESIQKEFVLEVPRARESALMGDYYVLNCTDLPAVLVECGYLSNPGEEADLCNSDYRKKFCETLLRGILNFYVI